MTKRISMNSISYKISQIGHNPRVQDKLREEIKSLYDDNGKIIYEKLIDNEYLDQVFYESLRLHPPATITNRECTEDIDLECVKGKIYKMKVGECVTIPIYSIHRNSG